MDPAPASGPALTLPAELGIEDAAALHTLLASRLDDPETVTLAAAGVARLHTAGLQVLAAFVRSRSAAGHGTVIENPSAELRTAAARLGLNPLLGIS